ncbi:zinc-ribbon domain-containing protein [Petroclostridium sp. X23]|uniref:zinc-ribbon domain-containing protein n=1 Tax=Petroclostridium sp. X23 TaxID=3045146 RepID=UPI0024ACD473|nr:zinc-ribbon domain-containing protein [Petroclostridium sp. X23]WHH58168.1 zinc-ribbon domain-containing protein [Petroclostridium sp. X23]
MADKNLTCKDCGATFVFTEGEQQFYAEKGFTNEPVRCKECRSSKKAQRNDGARRPSGGFSNNRGRSSSFSRF